MIPPGGTIGILGGGQLGRMLAIAAANLGYRTRILAPEASGPAADVSAGWTRADYADAAALGAFAAAVDVVTYEFENVPVDQLEVLGDKLRPGARALETAQDRLWEKRFVKELGGVPAPWYRVDRRTALDAGILSLGTPAILKTRRFGYDGKGQVRIDAATDAGAAWATLGGGKVPLILESHVPFEREFSVLLARGQGGEMRFWASPGNFHVDGILRHSAVPLPDMLLGQVEQARALSGRIAAALDYVGVLACEFFAAEQGPIFNEMAPRVHNSGHWTIEGAITSQFENHVRAICGLPLGPTDLVAPRVEMENLIGADVARCPAILAEPGAHLHLYGKHEARPGRKMGHVTRLGSA